MTEVVESGERQPVEVSLRSLLAAGVHFGHQTARWNPKMIPYIFGVRANLHIINLDLTLKAWERARKVIADTAANGGEVLFIGTKKQARDIIKGAAAASQSFHVTTRWLGGTLTNFQTIKNSVERMKKLEELLEKASQENTELKF